MSIFKYGAMALFVAGTLAYGGYAGSSLGSFDYASASPEARQEWLDKQAVSIGKTMNRSLPKGDGAQPHMTVSKTIADARAKRIDILVGISGPAKLAKNSSAAREYMLKGFCGNYMQTVIARNGISIGLKINYADGKQALSVAISPGACQPYVKA